MFEFFEGTIAVAFMMLVWCAVRIATGYKIGTEKDGDYYAILIVVLVILNGVAIAKIERKIDEMNQCGPAEVTVSDE